MEGLFLRILNMSITSGYVILFILAARLLLKKAPRGYSYALWGAALFRLCCPVSFESVWSLLPVGGKAVSPDLLYAAEPQIASGIAVVDRAVNSVLPAATPGNSVSPLQIWVAVGAAIWAAVAICMALYGVISALRLASKLKTAEHLEGNLYVTRAFRSPFVFGLLHPNIYLPVGLSGTETSYILRHEQTHIRRLDHLMKPLAFLALCIHWFNPLVWVAFFMSARDMELSCDERVVRELGGGVKQDYSASLLSLSTGRRIVGGCPLAFGENDVGARIKHVLNYKKPTFWVIVVAAVAVAAVGVGLLANPKETPQQTLAGQFLQYKTAYVGDNSKVGGIISLLEFPSDLKYEFFSLQTTSEPYGVTVHFTTDAASREYYDQPSHQERLLTNATLLFSLIGNLGEVDFVLSDGTQELSLRYSRALAASELGVDPGDFAQNEEQLTKLLPEPLAEAPSSFVPLGIVRDSAGADITQEIIRLWDAANKIYNVDDTELFEMGDTIRFAESAPEYTQLKNYDEVVARVFAPAGLAQLESAQIGGSARLIEKKDGKVYRMSPWKTGASDAQVIRIAVSTMGEAFMTLRVSYLKPSLAEPTATGAVTFVVRKTDGRWLVHSYPYPEASYPPQARAFYVPAMTEEQAQYNQQYVDPILLTGLLAQDWSADDYTALLPNPPEQDGSYLMYAFEDIMGLENMAPLREQYKGQFPAQVIEEVLLARFPFTTAQLHELLATYYRAGERIYAYEGGRGGGPIECAVTGVTTQGDGSVKVDYVFFTSYDADTSTPEGDAYLRKTPGVLTLKPTIGGYSYWSVDVRERVEIPPK